MRDYKIDELTGDMIITGGKVVEETDLYEVRQRVRTRLNKQLGEWRYNLASGIPWMPYGGEEGILGSKGQLDRARALISDTVSATDGVTGLNMVDVRFDTATRNFIISLDIATAYGNATIII